MMVFIATSWAAEPSILRDGHPDRRVVAVPARLDRAVAVDPEHALPKLVEWLVSDTEDDLLKARRIHDWVALNLRYDTSAFLDHTPVSADVGDVLSSGRAVCGGFANVFEAMSTIAGLEAVTISGYARGYGFDAFDESAPLKSDHAWNAVRVAGT